MRVIIGCAYSSPDETTVFAKDENGTIYIDGVPKNCENEKEFRYFVNLLNNPWSEMSVRYIIKRSGITSYSTKSLKWLCELQVDVYDGERAVLNGYGETPEEALADNKKLFERLRKRYGVSGNKRG